MKVEFNNSTKTFSVSRGEAVSNSEMQFETDDLINEIYGIIDKKISECDDYHELAYMNILKDKIYKAISEYVKETDGKPVEVSDDEE